MHRSLSALLVILGLAGCAGGPPPLQAIDRPVDLERFMGDWYVVGTIPIFLEAGAHNAVESYQLAPDGVIETTYRFRKDGFDGPLRTFTPRGFVRNKATNAEWGMQFVWPFRAAYLIAYLDDDYQRTIIGVPSRRWVWLMTRSPDVSDAAYAEMLSAAARLGYDPGQIRRVPQRWPEGPPQAGK